MDLLTTLEYERRKFPRLAADCPILYRLDNSNSWFLATLLDFSATTLCIISTQAINKNTRFEFQIKPGENALIPRFEGYASVNKCIFRTEHEYLLSCQIKKIHIP